MLRTMLIVACAKWIRGHDILIGKEVGHELQAKYQFDEKAEKKFATLRQRYYSFSYDPAKGYEPYWADGEEVLIDPLWELELSGKTTKRIPRVCGIECNTSYRNITEVCVHHQNQNRMKGCFPPLNAWLYCGGDPGDRFVDYFEEFDTYCAYLAHTCKAPWHDRYTLLHIGSCKTLDDWFKPMQPQDDIEGRMKAYSLYWSVPTPTAVSWPDKKSFDY